MPRFEGESIPENLRDPINLTRELFFVGAHPALDREVTPFKVGDHDEHIVYVESTTNPQGDKKIGAITYHRSLNELLAPILNSGESTDGVPDHYKDLNGGI